MIFRGQLWTVILQGEPETEVTTPTLSPDERSVIYEHYLYPRDLRLKRRMRHWWYYTQASLPPDLCTQKFQSANAGDNSQAWLNGVKNEPHWLLPPPPPPVQNYILPRSFKSSTTCSCPPLSPVTTKVPLARSLRIVLAVSRPSFREDRMTPVGPLFTQPLQYNPEYRRTMNEAVETDVWYWTSNQALIEIALYGFYRWLGSIANKRINIRRQVSPVGTSMNSHLGVIVHKRLNYQQLYAWSDGDLCQERFEEGFSPWEFTCSESKLANKSTIN